MDKESTSIDKEKLTGIIEQMKKLRNHNNE